MRRILSASPRPTAVFAANDHMALGAMEAIRRAGLDVPKDISVVGFDDVTEARRSDPPLTTIRQPLEEMAVMAAKLLLKEMEGKLPKKRPAPVVLQGRLVIRESCRKI